MTHPDLLNREENIRARAYRLWEEEGKPEGQSERFWELAEQLEAIETSPDAGLLPNPLSTRDTAPDGEPQEIMDNLGEFPGLTDQGERQQFPTDREHEARS